ncbi:hypothetical protein [Actinoplanes sp. NPDC049681]|uniref:hypothetical protein n=1 Tax=Actinoplanes sp. NPDC049681 TaxID=3363905 RepID=UPI0037ADC6C1
MPPKLKRPVLAPGPVADFVYLLFDLWCLAGCPTHRDLAKQMKANDDLPASPSHETIRKALGRDAPTRWHDVEAITRMLAELAGKNPTGPGSSLVSSASLLEDVRHRWTRARFAPEAEAIPSQRVTDRRPALPDTSVPEPLARSERQPITRQARAVVLTDAGCSGQQFLTVSDFQVRLGNYGAEPILRIEARLFYPTADGKALHPRGPAQFGLGVLPVLPAGAPPKSLNWDLKGLSVSWPAGLEPHQLPALFRTEVEFTDVDGDRWLVALNEQARRVK